MRSLSSITGALQGFAVAMLLALPSSCSMVAHAQDIAPKSKQEGKPATKEQVKADEHKSPAERGEVIDRIVAIVNGDLVLESDVEEEERFSRLYPYGVAEDKSPREQALTRLIDRTLILQQEAGYIITPVTDDQINREESDLRKDLPACAHADCSSDAGWKKFLTDLGFTEDELRDRLKQRAQVLHFIEQRFRAGVRINDKQISEFYTNTMLPAYAKQNATAPPLDSVHDRIEEVLLQQQVSSLLDQWLKALHDSGHVRVMQKGQEAP
jgi:peptidyl-prolyl cis-trans isomerase SurA